MQHTRSGSADRGWAGRTWPLCLPERARRTRAVLSGARSDAGRRLTLRRAEARVKARAEMGIGARRQINLRRRNVREGVECAFLVRLRTAATRARVRRYRVIELLASENANCGRVSGGNKLRPGRPCLTVPLLPDCSVVTVRMPRKSWVVVLQLLPLRPPRLPGGVRSHDRVRGVACKTCRLSIRRAD